MPFDAMVMGKESLADTLARLGIVPVPMATLEAHKAEQVRKHPASWQIRPAPYVAVAVAASVGVAYALLHGESLGLAAFGAAVVCMIFGAAVAFLFFSVVLLVSDIWEIEFYKAAKWHEYWCTSYEAPPSIATIARLVERAVPDAKLILGELYQEVVLDPYMVVQIGGERACLGIWDGDTIIASAQLTD